MGIMKPFSVLMVCGILFFCLPSNAPAQQGLIDYSVVMNQTALKQLIDSQKNILIIVLHPLQFTSEGTFQGQRILNSPTQLSIWINGMPR